MVEKSWEKRISINEILKWLTRHEKKNVQQPNEFESAPDMISLNSNNSEISMYVSVKNSPSPMSKRKMSCFNKSLVEQSKSIVLFEESETLERKNMNPLENSLKYLGMKSMKNNVIQRSTTRDNTMGAGKSEILLQVQILIEKYVI